MAQRGRTSTLLTRSLIAAALDMVSMVEAMDSPDDVESPAVVTALEAWAAVHGTQRAQSADEVMNSALIALEVAIGFSAQWVGSKLGSDARDRFLLDLRGELLADHDSSPAE